MRRLDRLGNNLVDSYFLTRSSVVIMPGLDGPIKNPYFLISETSSSCPTAIKMVLDRYNYSFLMLHTQCNALAQSVS